jgi:hypothetical protein
LLSHRVFVSRPAKKDIVECCGTARAVATGTGVYHNNSVSLTEWMCTRSLVHVRVEISHIEVFAGNLRTKALRPWAG